MIKKEMNKEKKDVRILGVRIDNLSKEDVFKKIENFLSDGKFHQIATVNPEFILEAQKNIEFRNILNNTELNIADGFGIKFAFWKKGEKLKTRLAGVDLMEEILKMASNRELQIFLVANKNGLSSWEETAEAIKRFYPKLKISGINIDKNNSSYKLQIAGYKIIFCNFGHPYQELFLNRQKDVIIGIAIGVGGSFDFLTRKQRRAPLWMRNLGLEWLFRLWKQPSRFRRIFRAVIIFPIKIIFNKK